MTLFTASRARPRAPGDRAKEVSAAPAAPAPIERRRGKYETSFFGHGYESYFDADWTWKADGPLLTSRLLSGHHAPVLDVDRPISAERLGDGTGTIVTIPDLRRGQAWKVARSLDRAGFCLPDMEEVVDGLRVRRWRRWREKVTLVLPLALHVEVFPSPTPGHHHVLVNDVMSWARTRMLVVALAGPVVDESWTNRNNNKDTGLVVRHPID